MRLLNTQTEELEEFFDGAIPSKYAVLSHRWGSEEVSYRDWTSRTAWSVPPGRDSFLEGFQKIQHCCDQARKEGIDWVWIDTCCIDKTSSSELSEAINSMFTWYRNSTVCYVHLYDYDGIHFTVPDLEKCEWWYRGWTLQELIAPRKVCFYNKKWQYFGAKSDDNVCKVISTITKIDTAFLLGSDLESASIAKRMSWAANRTTSRTEDLAYCLMGLFDINMPLLYGEGPKAFRRLQEEILKAYPTDHSLYAWGTPVEKCSIELRTEEEALQLIRGNPEDWPTSSGPLHGLLARSPHDFKFSGNYSPLFWAEHIYISNSSMDSAMYASATRNGVMIELPTSGGDIKFCHQFNEHSVRQVREGYRVVLLCEDETDDYVTLMVPVVRGSLGYYSRPGELIIDRSRKISLCRDDMITENRQIIYSAPDKQDKLKSGDIVLRSILDFRKENSRYFWMFGTNWKHGGVWLDNSLRLIHAEPNLSGRYCGLYSKTMESSATWKILVGREYVQELDYPAFQAGIVEAGSYASEFTADFRCRKVFQTPSDEFIIDIEACPKIEIYVERLTLPEGGYIDVVDIFIREKPTQNGKKDDYTKNSDADNNDVGADSSSDASNNDGLEHMSRVTSQEIREQP